MEFEDFYKESRDLCFRAVLAGVKSADMAYEVLATAYERALAQWDEIHTHPNQYGWIVKTALNLHKDEMRHRTNWKSLFFVKPFSYEQQSEGIDQELLKKIRALPEQQRSVIAYRVILDLSVEATANLMEIAPSTVSVHLKRALAALRNQLIESEWSQGYDR